MKALTLDDEGLHSELFGKHMEWFGEFFLSKVNSIVSESIGQELCYGCTKPIFYGIEADVYGSLNLNFQGEGDRIVSIDMTVCGTYPLLDFAFSVEGGEEGIFDGNLHGSRLAMALSAIANYVGTELEEEFK